ncbi:MAG: hypothetical protein DSM107014_08465 [Gomphosphaeria aponina SAG 52.96 = DSM 107014]|uniref:Uncharacterized protein n=1 Tax=Gomphosphaeria aponina SAG 52.96 = DSM 107014 TaxID=1521640 RepID=A0A941JS56_9CHRO|nr:hypothetical protein [Gomphosphaeria aponina SAG 52.96 = DSM 107014]
MNLFRVRKNIKGGDRLSYYLEFWLPSLILIMVALGQIYLAQTANLSPWKGGGFGMFAAIDAPSMRVIVAEGIDQKGQLLRLDIFDALDDSTVRRMLALARQKDLENIAPQLLSQPIVPTTIQQQATFEKLLGENSNTQIVEQLGKVELTPPGGIKSLPLPLYRLKTAYDPEIPAAMKTLKAVRLQWWKIKFNQGEKRIFAEPLSELIKVGDW